MEVGEIKLTEHPRARASIRRTKGLAGLGVFVLVGLLSLRGGSLPAEALARALIGGIAAFFVSWALAVTIWRYVALGELEAARERRQARIASLVGDEA